MKDERWVFYKDTVAVNAGEGVTRRVLAYSDDLMCVENSFKKGAVGALHHHPHTQITYIVSGKFEFEIDGVKKVVQKGDTMLKMHDVVHGCVCLEEGLLLDIFNPYRKDFV
ncbi:cupin domain-containing protein [Treponema pectinovorum]|uniref:cupin domain-containing protein n=1 Tax=Treponema pectinovorum TaxID=164 RepID=UPI0011CC96B2|nr:cupin domain-containing protein [Treponema pectinovorum]